MSDLVSVGYYSRIGVKYDVSAEDLAKAYKRTALINHPDRNGSTAEANRTFADLQTAKTVLENNEKREGYDRIVRLRTWLSQHDDVTETVDPYLLFSIYKINRHMSVQRRLMTIDFVKRELKNWKKDELKKTFPFDTIKGVRTVDYREFELLFSKHDSYHLRAHSAKDKNTILKLLKGIISNTLTVRMDDAELPPKSLLKGEVEKKGGIGSYTKRHIMVGTKQILIFREEHYHGLTNCMSLISKCTEMKTSSSNILSLRNPETRMTLRFEQQTIRNRWEFVIRQILSGNQSEAPTNNGKRESITEDLKQNQNIFPTSSTFLRIMDSIDKTDDEDDDSDMESQRTSRSFTPSEFPSTTNEPIVLGGPNDDIHSSNMILPSNRSNQRAHTDFAPAVNTCLRTSSLRDANEANHARNIRDFPMDAGDQSSAEICVANTKLLQDENLESMELHVKTLNVTLAEVRSEIGQTEMKLKNLRKVEADIVASISQTRC